KGPAVRALRAQADKFQYQNHMKKVLEDEPNLLLRQALVERLLIEDGEVRGVVTNTGSEYRAKAVIVTTGTFMRGQIIIGELAYESG
ncbi:FAD-dependent oxidoreductase, partial [Bacillus sp. SIMBA_161]